MKSSKLFSWIKVTFWHRCQQTTWTILTSQVLIKRTVRLSTVFWKGTAHIRFLTSSAWVWHFLFSTHLRRRWWQNTLSCWMILCRANQTWSATSARWQTSKQFRLIPLLKFNLNKNFSESLTVSSNILKRSHMAVTWITDCTNRYQG